MGKPKRSFRFRVLIAGVLLVTPPLLADSAEQPPAHPHSATSHRSFDDVEHWTKIFDDPGRDKWQKPDEVVAALKLDRGEAVADLGAGTGYFSRYLSAAVGEQGAVFAVDVEPRLLERIRERAEKEKTANVVPVLASMDDARLPPGRIDVILIVDTYHHFDDRIAYLRRLAKALSAEGRIAIIDWFKRELPEGPPPDHKLPRKHVVKEMQAAGYELVEEPTFLPYQYYLIFRRRHQPPF